MGNAQKPNAQDEHQNEQFIMKKCAKCGRIMPAGGQYSQFHKFTGTKDGFYPSCKVCRQEFYDDKREEILPKQRAYKKKKYDENPEGERERVYAYYAANPEKKREANRRYYERNKERWKEYAKKKSRETEKLQEAKES